MPDMRDLIHLGNLIQIRRVLTALGPERIERGLTAFEDGGSNWSHCFFGRAFEGEANLTLKPEKILMARLGLPTPVPIRIVYQTFDGANAGLMTKAQLRELIEAVLDESRPQEVLDLIRSIKYNTEKGIECSSTPSFV